MTHPKQKEYSKRWYEKHKDTALRWSKEWREGNPDYHSEYSKEYYKANSETIRWSVAQWAEDNPEKVIAQNTFKSQIRNGSIIRPEMCSACGNSSKILGHHEDYNKPLEVLWLCRSCHKRVHARTLSFVH